jgi:murein DD-endopeptidase MepM/ murein hydrolase activator NlpD
MTDSTARLAALGLALTLGACASGGRPQPTSIPTGWPVAPSAASVSAAFGIERGGSRHQGIDLGAPAGTAVWSTADGTVVAAGRDGRYGRTVVVDHGGGYRTRYAHLKKIETRVGRRVRRGDLIGRVGRSGNAKGAHLHYEVLLHGRPVDPRPYLG